jgi:Glycosyltransferase sugar-binding region containing DXD motif
MPPTRYTDIEYTERRENENWVRLAEFLDDFEAFRKFVKDPKNGHHQTFGTPAMDDVANFYDEIKEERGGRLRIYLDTSRKAKFVTMHSAKNRGKLLVWSCDHRTTIHFVWLGPYQGAHCTDTPVIVAKECPEQEVWLWVFKEHKTEFEKRTQGSNVKVKLLDISERLLGDEKWVKDAYVVINNLISLKLWIAAKDLAVLLIMHEYGGLYFDTTVIVATEAECEKYAPIANVKARSLPHAVRTVCSSAFMLPLAKDSPLNAYQPGVCTVKSVTTGFDDAEKRKGKPYTEAMPPVEVWAYFSPDKHHKVFSVAATSYLKRASVLGLDDPNCPDNHVGRKELLNNERQDEIIGQLITQSIYDGLAGVPSDDNPVNFKTIIAAIEQMTWCAKTFKDKPTRLPAGGTVDGRADILPEFGIIKQYKGTWRKKKI